MSCHQTRGCQWPYLLATTEYCRTPLAFWKGMAGDEKDSGNDSPGHLISHGRQEYRSRQTAFRCLRRGAAIHSVHGGNRTGVRTRRQNSKSHPLARHLVDKNFNGFCWISPNVRDCLVSIFGVHQRCDMETATYLVPLLARQDLQYSYEVNTGKGLILVRPEGGKRLS